MSANSLEINGKLTANSLAELLAEVSCFMIDGSFRLSNQAQKIVIYLRAGEIVFAVSNSRQHRLFEILIKFGQLKPEDLKQFENAGNDMELANQLVEKNLFTRSNVDILLVEQVKQVVQLGLSWNEGDWSFTPLARIKDNICFTINSKRLLLDFARQMTIESVVDRFKTRANQSIEVKNSNLAANLTPQEGFVLSRIEGKPDLNGFLMSCGLPEPQALQSIYTLWLGGVIQRNNPDAAFTAEQIERFDSVKYKLSEQIKVEKPKPEEIVVEQVAPTATTATTVEEDSTAEKEPDTIEAYLLRIEKSVSYYNLLGVENTSEISQIKKIYFGLAQQFHPDKYHQEEEKIKKRLQDAFSQLAAAYETLRDKDQRELYDFKLKRKLAANAEAEEMKKAEKAKGNGDDVDSKVQKLQFAKNYFDQGFSLLMANEAEKAVPFLANATSLAPQIAKYHAYYGKALIGNKKFRHQAEQELLSAIKIEATNADFRIMLIEFYMEYGLKKRAEGELQKLFELDPKNKEAATLLDKLDKK
jgi:curved DNA-binding protein CbpA